MAFHLDNRDNVRISSGMERCCRSTQRRIFKIGLVAALHW
jgi:hypothetical protein